MACFKDATVCEVISWNGDQIHWDLSLLRRPNDSEEESVCNLLAKLVDMGVVPQGNDELVWPHDQKGFSISRIFVMLFMISLIFLQLTSGGQKLLCKLFFFFGLGNHVRRNLNGGPS